MVSDIIKVDRYRLLLNELQTLYSDLHVLNLFFLLRTIVSILKIDLRRDSFIFFKLVYAALLLWLIDLIQDYLI